MSLLRNAIKTLAVFAVLLAVVSGITVSAAGFYSYSYNSDKKAVASPEAVQPYKTIYGTDLGLTDFKSPQDIFIYNDEIYIADTENNRIVITDLQFSDIRVIDAFDHDGTADSFNKPSGICVTADALYIADTDHARLVKLTLDGTLIKIIEAPHDESFDKDFFFKPVKIAVDNYGRIFVISSGYNMGLMQFDENGVYLKSVGAPRVSMSVVEMMWRKIATKAQKERSESYVPTEYSNLSINQQGFIYVTSESTSKEITALRKLNAKGSDVLGGDEMRFGDKVSGGVTYTGNSAIVDFCKLEDDNFAILDRKRSRVFVYNENCEMLYAFSGPGKYSGGLYIPSAMEYSNDKFYICDSGKNALCIFQLTDYGCLFRDIAAARKSIDFKQEEKLWNEVIFRNENCTLAMSGLGNAAYKNHDMQEAMKYYRLAGDKTNYSKAYAFVRREFIESNIASIVVMVLAAVTVLVLAGRFKKKKIAGIAKDSFFYKWNFSSYTTFHPMDGFWDLKREKRGSTLVAAIILMVSVIVFLIGNLCSGFIFNTTDTKTYNMAGNILFILGGVLLWCISQWCVTSLMDGEGKFTDIFIATCYALRPYIALNIVAVVLSNVLLLNEGDFYYVLTYISILWVAALIVVSVKQTHNYSMGKTLLVILIILIVILLIVFIGMLVFALCQQLIAFVRDLISEITLRV